MSKPFFFSLEPRLLMRRRITRSEDVWHVWHRAEEPLHELGVLGADEPRHELRRCFCDPVTIHSWDIQGGQIWIHRRVSA